MAKPRKKTSPATKADIELLMDSISKLYEANEGWKNELKGHFDLAVETIRHDLLGATHDRLENHDDRIRRLEKHAGLTMT